MVNYAPGFEKFRVFFKMNFDYLRKMTSLFTENEIEQRLMMELFDMLRSTQSLSKFKQLLLVIILIFDDKSIPIEESLIPNTMPSEYYDMMSFRNVVDMEELMEIYKKNIPNVSDIFPTSNEEIKTQSLDIENLQTITYRKWGFDEVGFKIDQNENFVEEILTGLKIPIKEASNERMLLASGNSTVRDLMMGFTAPFCLIFGCLWGDAAEVPTSESPLSHYKVKQHLIVQRITNILNFHSIYTEYECFATAFFSAIYICENCRDVRNIEDYR